MVSRLAGALALSLFTPAALWSQGTVNPVVRFHTNLGGIDVTLLPNSAPRTVENFFAYMNRGAFDNSVIHRSVSKFIFQGGGYQLKDHKLAEIAQDPPVRNEFSVSNLRGTLAMAKLGGDANSATNQWFFNLADNSRTLNSQNGGFTVFGRVANAASLDVMDKIAAVPVPNPAYFSSPFDQLPLLNWITGTPPTDENYVLVLGITMLDQTPAISPNGVITASNFGGFAAAAVGSYIEIYGANLGADPGRGWVGSDFIDGNAPTSLDGVSVTVGGQAAFVNYASARQVNVQVPLNVAAGDRIPVVVTYRGLVSAPVAIRIKPLAGGLLAPASFNAGAKQYAVAIHSANGAFVSNGTITGVPAAPAAPGETLVFYGTGFGPVSPASTPITGQIAQGQTALTTPVEFKFGGLSGQIVYAGLAPGLTGVYQFNVTVPSGAVSGDLPLEVFQGGESIGQTLFVSVLR